MRRSRPVARRSGLRELAAGASIGSGFGMAAYSLDHGSLWTAVFFGLWGALLTVLVASTT